MFSYIPWLPIVPAIVACLIIFLLYRARENKRIEELRSLALLMGFSFDKDWSINIKEKFGHFHLFSQGHNRKIMNRLYGQRNGIEVSIFSYRFTEGYGKNQRTYTQTVLLITSDKTNFPAFELRPENLLHKIGSIFGFQDIDIESHAQFSKSYLLRGKDETQIKNIFSDIVLLYFEQNKGLCIEAFQTDFLFYRAHKQIAPAKIRTFFNNGYEVFNLFRT